MSTTHKAGNREREHRYWTLARASVRSPATLPEGGRVSYASTDPKAWCASAIGEDLWFGGAASFQRCGFYRRLSATGFHDPFQDVLETKVHTARTAIQTRRAGPKVRAHLIRRLLELVDMAADEYPDTEVPNQQTLYSAVSLFSARRDVREPLLGLTSAGGIWAEWREGTNSAAVEFLRNGSVNLVAFFADPEEPLRSASIAANLSWKSASRELRANPALGWIRAR